MTKKLIIPDDLKQPEDNVLDFPAVKPAIKEEDPDWLWHLPDASIFFVSPPLERDPYNRPILNPLLKQYHVIQHVDSPRLVMLLDNLNTESFLWVDSRDFSTMFKLKKVLRRGDSE